MKKTTQPRTKQPAPLPQHLDISIGRLQSAYMSIQKWIIDRYTPQLWQESIPDDRKFTIDSLEAAIVWLGLIDPAIARRGTIRSSELTIDRLSWSFIKMQRWIATIDRAKWEQADPLDREKLIESLEAAYAGLYGIDRKAKEQHEKAIKASKQRSTE